MRFEVVNHTYQYPKLLGYQLSSLVLNGSGDHTIRYSVYHDSMDEATVRTLDYFEPLLPSAVTMHRHHQCVSLLKNRAIGRNERAKANEADWVWFADTDYFFCKDMWDMLAFKSKLVRVPLVWPGTVLATEWDYGDELMRAMDKPTVLAVEPSSCHFRTMNRAIGGMQIVHGPALKEKGYCPNYLGPRKDWDFSSDVKFRRQFKEREHVGYLNVVRIRHRDKGYGKDRKEVVN